MGAEYNGNIVDLLITQFGLGIFSQYFIGESGNCMSDNLTANLCPSRAITTTTNITRSKVLSMFRRNKKNKKKKPRSLIHLSREKSEKKLKPEWLMSKSSCDCDHASRTLTNLINSAESFECHEFFPVETQFPKRHFQALINRKLLQKVNRNSFVAEINLRVKSFVEWNNFG